jgi:predicted protein tyrosine phosphatase
MAEIIICRASEVLKIVTENPVAAVLSIEHPGAALDKSGAAPRLVDNGHDKIPQKILVFWDSEQPVKDGPDVEQVKAGIEFVMDHISKGPVIIHCHAGKARSVGVALGVLSLVYPDKEEKELLDMLLAIRPQAAPNILVVEMVDQLTGRGGKLLQAVLGHPVLSEQRAKAERNRKDMMEERPEYYKRMFPEKFPQEPKGPQP